MASRYGVLFLVLLSAATSVESLCYWSPITGVRTCTSWAGPPKQPGGGKPSSPGRPWGPPSRPWHPPRSTPAPTDAPVYTDPPTPAPTLAPYTEPPTQAPTPAPTISYIEEATYLPGTPDPTRGCLGNLPFGLENCVCTGAEIGEAAGLAACSAVFTECGGGITEFSFRADQLVAVQRACDALASGSCVMTGKQLAMSHPVCADLLMGKGSCSADTAQEILEASLDRTCEPLCPDCQNELKPEDTVPSAEEDEDEMDPEEMTKVPAGEEDTPIEVYLETQQPEDGAQQYETPEPRPITPQEPVSESRGCVGDLPFGLEECVCDGAEVGEAAGLAACSVLFSECQELTPFGADQVGKDIESITRACDEFAHSTCRDVSTQFALQTEPCARLLFNGNGKCTAAQARDIFTRHTVMVCEPVCPECTGRPKP
mmetsp:Transcript_32810/g.93108  ORF Transcript_32810/g.93108 Transcript_32810/m.93108 type:complete len:428 (-) Transcript_32810:474-1757(-)|eukprot:CAMPEP_0117667772 /NCGR_PEP_ID=MMETSP0804-20121206/11161_1 /TAXON_ID=1074897 /ORGANISM="Tetraselmis astigmatica, Strain CCMP880" /LENGTH=427 /DNA_ID=CAMNT_0005475553 /DNA_START=146 /DNA_END=1429 /DNA_ORIENTATION=+